MANTTQFQQYLDHLLDDFQEANPLRTPEVDLLRKRLPQVFQTAGSNIRTDVKVGVATFVLGWALLALASLMLGAAATLELPELVESLFLVFAAFELGTFALFFLPSAGTVGLLRVAYVLFWRLIPHYRNGGKFNPAQLLLLLVVNSDGGHIVLPITEFVLVPELRGLLGIMLWDFKLRLLRRRKIS